MSRPAASAELPPLPTAFVERARSWLGDETDDFLAALDRPPAGGARLNPLRGPAVESRLLLPSASTPVPWCPTGWTIPDDNDQRLSRTPAWMGGAYYLQEPAAMLPAALLAPMPGEWVLDLCAAPGGKSSQLAAAMDQQGLLVANEIDAGRARALIENLELAGIANAIVTIERPDRLAEQWPDLFDAVMVDAPCSGEAMFAKHAAARQGWSPEAVQGCADRQFAILNDAATMVRPGGRLVYATCAFSPAENEALIARFLAEHADFQAEPIDHIALGVSPGLSGPWGDGAGCARIWPHRARALGQFAARLRRLPADTDAGPVLRHSGCVVGDAISKSERTEIEAWLPLGVTADFRSCGTLFFLPPPMLPPALDRLRLGRVGIAVAERQGRSLRPHQAAALALPFQHLPSFELDDEQTQNYLRGHEITLPAAPGTSGWHIIRWQQLPLAWGKISGNRIKNHLPKSRRFN